MTPACQLASSSARQDCIAKIIARVTCTLTQNRSVVNRVCEQQKAFDASNYANSKTGCVKAPQDCDKWELTERDTASAGSAIADSDSIAVGDQQSPPIDHCQVCRAAVYTCQQNCRGDKACETTCSCPVTDQDSCHKCSTTTCSTTAQVADTNDPESPPIDHCQVCRSAIYACQQNCNGDQACKTACLCPSTERESCGKCQSFNCPSS